MIAPMSYVITTCLPLSYSVQRRMVGIRFVMVLKKYFKLKVVGTRCEHSVYTMNTSVFKVSQLSHTPITY